MGPRKLLVLAAHASKRGNSDKRKHSIGALAIRRDGAMVVARNGSCTHVCYAAHAEARLLRKAGQYSTIYVSRMKKSGHLGNARPCKNCLTLMCSHKVARCYYSISNNEYGVLEL